MIVLVILISTFLITALVTKLIFKQWNIAFSGNMAMCTMLCFTAVGHFVFAEGMEMMMPPFIPFKKALVFLTGIIEIGAGVGLLFPRDRRPVAILLIIFFVLILPANIYAAIKKVDLQKAAYTGPALGYLWFRIPMQVLLIAWVWYFGIHKRPSSKHI